MKSTEFPLVSQGMPIGVVAETGSIVLRMPPYLLAGVAVAGVVTAGFVAATVVATGLVVEGLVAAELGAAGLAAVGWEVVAAAGAGVLVPQAVTIRMEDKRAAKSATNFFTLSPLISG